VFTNPDEAIATLRKQNIEKARIIGGASIYAYFIDKVDVLHLTLVKQKYEGDTFFPEYQQLFTETSREIYPTHDFIVYKKNNA
jgi:dihydrofolate reductase